MVVVVADWPNGLGFEAAGWPKIDDVPAGFPNSDIVRGVRKRNGRPVREKRQAGVIVVGSNSVGCSGRENENKGYL